MANFLINWQTQLIALLNYPALGIRRVKAGCCFVGGDDLTGALHILQLQLSPPPPSSLAPIKSRMETFWHRGPRGKLAVKLERDCHCQSQCQRYAGMTKSLVR